MVHEFSSELVVCLQECMKQYGDDSSANLELVTTRQETIASLDVISKTISELMEMIQMTAGRLRDAQDIEIRRINDVLRGLEPSAKCRRGVLPAICAADMTDARPYESQEYRSDNVPHGWSAGGRPRRMIAAVPPVIGKIETPADMTKIKFTDTFSLIARPVDNFADVAADGQLYWVKSSGHFAFKIAGVLFHGNIGTIYNDDRTPCKLRDCAYPKTCDRADKCPYYHDPTIFPGSTDIRNYAAGSFMYAGSGSSYRARGRSRQFGSRDRLDMDVMNVKADESARLRDQVMHDLLCALLLKNIVG